MNTFKQNLLKTFAFTCVAIGAVVIPSTHARAVIVNVTINGSVEWNFITTPPLGGAQVGQAAQLTFTVDSDNFQNNPAYPTRGYPIDKASFKLAFPTTSISTGSARSYGLRFTGSRMTSGSPQPVSTG